MFANKSVRLTKLFARQRTKDRSTADDGLAGSQQAMFRNANKPNRPLWFPLKEAQRFILQPPRLIPNWNQQDVAKSNPGGLFPGRQAIPEAWSTVPPTNMEVQKSLSRKVVLPGVCAQPRASGRVHRWVHSGSSREFARWREALPAPGWCSCAPAPGASGVKPKRPAIPRWSWLVQ